MKPKQIVSEAYPELHHYTTVTGLSGILDSLSLHATNAAYSNDSTEIQLFFRERLAKILESGIRAELESNPRLRVLPEFANTDEEADAVVHRYAMDMADAIRSVMQHFNRPHIVCFSTPGNARVTRDGLLSQWRGYGKEGGYVLVFDTAGLEKLIKKESEDFLYQHMQWGDVHYYQEDDDIEHANPEILEAEELLRRAIRAYINNPTAEQLENFFGPVTTLSCLYKHWGFHEEHEVRIIAIPPTAELVKEARKDGETRPIRESKIMHKNGMPIPYMELFSRMHDESTNAYTEFPIKRILVGPHPQSELRRSAVQEMLQVRGIIAPVEVSRIPFIGC